jgi:hypothetical protein
LRGLQPARCVVAHRRRGVRDPASIVRRASRCLRRNSSRGPAHSSRGRVYSAGGDVPSPRGAARQGTRRTPLRSTPRALTSRSRGHSARVRCLTSPTSALRWRTAPRSSRSPHHPSRCPSCHDRLLASAGQRACVGGVRVSTGFVPSTLHGVHATSRVKRLASRGERVTVTRVPLCSRGVCAATSRSPVPRCHR